MNRLRKAWKYLHAGLADEEEPKPDDIEEARRMRRIAEQGLADARSQTVEVDQVTHALRTNQRELDFTALVEDAFMRRRPSAR
jgi:hypothetical protein